MASAREDYFERASDEELLDIPGGCGPQRRGELGGGGGGGPAVSRQQTTPHGSFPAAQLPRVPPQVRAEKKHIYEPLVVSLGPVRHREPGLVPYEEFKDRVLSLMLQDRGGVDPVFGRAAIRNRLHDIRSFYKHYDEIQLYEDNELVEVMFRDAWFVIYYMRMVSQYREEVRHAIQTIGALGLMVMANDFYKLENQIPWWIIKSLITSKYGESAGKELIRSYLSYGNFCDRKKLVQCPWESQEDPEPPPPHLLEAHRRICLMKKTEEKKKKIDITTELLRSPFRSATELRAKGIHFQKSSNFFDDISFDSHLLHGVLRLPVLLVSSGTATFLSNVVVLEMSPGNTSTDFPVTSYVNFMKSLIESPKDVKLLQEKGIIISYLMSNEQVVGVLKEIDTHEMDNFNMFNDIKVQINEHCSNRGKTWMAELFDSYFRSPWTAFALIATGFLLCLTFIQTIFTIKSNPIQSIKRS